MRCLCCTVCPCLDVPSSRSGDLLAVGGDDQLVTVWQFSGRTRTGGTLGETGSRAGVREQWKLLATLRGHAHDVLHLEWSRDQRYIASCSADTNVMVWNANRFPGTTPASRFIAGVLVFPFSERVSVLSGHSDMVKGVTWDPMGRYLASQAADKTLKIWSTNNWQCVRTIKEPFEEVRTPIIRLL